MAMKDEFFHAVRCLLQEHTARWQEAGVELTKPQYAVMRALDERPGSDQATLSELAAIAPPTLVELLVRMEQRGLLERRPDPDDRRRRTVWLTEHGREVLAAARDRVDAVEERFLAVLDPAERTALAATLRKLVAADGAQDGARNDARID